MSFLRKYYTPGAISLIFLPIAFVFYADKKMKIPKEYVQEIMPFSSKDSNWIKKIIPDYYFKSKSEYEITSDKIANKRVLKEVLVELNQLAASGTQKSSICLRIHDETPIQEYVNLYDWLYEHDIKRYIFLDNYLYCIPIQYKEKIMGGLTNCVIPFNLDEFNPNMSQKFNYKNYLWEFGKEALILYLLFVLSKIYIKIKMPQIT